MDRRVVAGLAGILLVGCASHGRAQTGPGRDPSAQPPVGLMPLRSIGESINNTTDASGTIPMASPAVPTSPLDRGPAATIPRPPVPTSPIRMTPIEPIGQSIQSGFHRGAISAMFRRMRPQDEAVPKSRPRAEVAPRTITQAEAVPRTMPQVEVAPKVNPPTIAASSPDQLLPNPDQLLPDPDQLLPGPASPLPAGRPAPFAGQVPDQARLQADPAPSPNPDAVPGAGRPAPLAYDIPEAARPRADAADRPPTPRPQAPPSNPPAFKQAEPPTAAEPVPIDPPSMPPIGPPPTPLELPPPPALETIPTPPIGIDPLQGMTIPPTIPPAAAAPEPAPVPAPAPEPSPAPVGTSAATSEPARPPVDPALRRTGGDEVAILTAPLASRKEPNQITFRAAAAVGDEIITVNELDAIVEERYREIPPEQRQGMSKEERIYVANQIGSQALESLIDQSLILQEAKREMKNPKAQTTFNDYIEKLWKENELPPLLRQTASANAYELKVKLAEQGKSYASMKESFRKKTLAREFLGAKIHNKITCDLAEQRAYYNEHLNNYVQPARMTWREIEVNMARSPGRAAARKKAEEILARLLHNEDFDAIARSTSNGPTASKGGLYVNMQPGSYGIPVVNDALNRLPVGQISPILEAPGSFFIVRIDERRDKGPLRFDEVQTKIRNQVLEQNYQIAVEAYITKLRAKTLVRMMYDSPEGDPAQGRRNDASVRPASSRQGPPIR